VILRSTSIGILGSLLACTAAAVRQNDTAIAPARAQRAADTLPRPVPAGIPDTTPDRGENPLLTTLRDSLRRRNPRIDTVAVIELRRFYPDLGSYLLLGYGVRTLDTTQGPLEDELFGLFAVNDSLTRILRTVDVFPTRRWRDYRVWMTRFTPDSVEIEGAGQMYGDQPMQRRYKWK
jgi:hypothetical protein